MPNSKYSYHHHLKCFGFCWLGTIRYESELKTGRVMLRNSPHAKIEACMGPPPIINEPCRSCGVWLKQQSHSGDWNNQTDINWSCLRRGDSTLPSSIIHTQEPSPGSAAHRVSAADKTESGTSITCIICAPYQRLIELLHAPPNMCNPPWPSTARLSAFSSHVLKPLFLPLFCRLMHLFGGAEEEADAADGLCLRVCVQVCVSAGDRWGSAAVSDDQQGSSPVVTNIKETSGPANRPAWSALAVCAVKEIM